MMDKKAIDRWYTQRQPFERLMYVALLAQEKLDAIPGGDPLEPARRAISATDRLRDRIGSNEFGRWLLASDPPTISELETFGPPQYQKAVGGKLCAGCRALSARGVEVLACSECDERIA